MSQKKYLVILTKDEETLLHTIINKGKHGAQKRKQAQALLLANEGYTDEMIADRVGMHCRAIESLRQRFVEDGFEVALEGKPRGHRPRSIQGEEEARLIALVYGSTPEGCASRTMRLLADTWVTLEKWDTKTVSREAIGQTLKKTHLKPRQNREWCIPPEGNGEFVACMEDVRDVYTPERDTNRPVVCKDESPKRLIGETRVPLPAEPGKPAYFDRE
jgi:transposase